MLLPRYYFLHTYDAYRDWLASQPHTETLYKKNEYLLPYGVPMEQIFFIKSGIAVAKLSHEDGHEKILEFHGVGSIFPGCDDVEFKIELSIALMAVSDVHVMRFQHEDFLRFLDKNPGLRRTMFNWYSAEINLRLYEAAHQDYNSAFLKLCNLLYLFSLNGPGTNSRIIPLTQDEVSQILTTSRINIARNLSRLRDEGIITTRRKGIEISNPLKLRAYCTKETLSEQ